MVKAGSPDPPDRSKGEPTSPVTRLIKGLLLLPLGLFLLLALGTLASAALYLGYLVARGTVFDTWGVLAVVSALLSLAAIAGAGFALLRRRVILALAFSVLALPVQFVTEGSRCDTAAACRAMGWAALPAPAFSWSVRIRPVTDPNEAMAIASGALPQSDAGVSPFKAKRFRDHWIVSTIDGDGWPGPHAVKIDTRTARTKLVSCPAGKIQCGMERPTFSDGRRVFRNDRLGVAAVFPASRSVCTSRGDDDEPRGFFALVRAPDIPCDVLDNSRQMGVEVARYRKKGCTAVDAPSLPWRELSAETAQLFRTRPTLGAGPSFACELHERDQIQISVYAFADSPSHQGASRGALYESYIVTTPAHLAEDVRLFEDFLKGVRIDALT